MGSDNGHRIPFGPSDRDDDSFGHMGGFVAPSDPFAEEDREPPAEHPQTMPETAISRHVRDVHEAFDVYEGVFVIATEVLAATIVALAQDLFEDGQPLTEHQQHKLLAALMLANTEARDTARKYLAQHLTMKRIAAESALPRGGQLHLKTLREHMQEQSAGRDG